MSVEKITLTELLAKSDPQFHQELLSQTNQVESFSNALFLNTVRKRAAIAGLAQGSDKAIKVAILGGCSLRPLADLIEHFTSVFLGSPVTLWLGAYDNYTSEIIDPSSDLYSFSPDIIVLLPSERRCKYMGTFVDPLELQLQEATRNSVDIIQLCQTAYDRTHAEIILFNFKLDPSPDPGPIRSTSLLSVYSFKKEVNATIGRLLKPFIHICDAEFIANRMGTVNAFDDKSWFESKLPGSKEYILAAAKEVAHIIRSLRQAPKKVVVLDLDNTLWGGVVGDDGLDGIELGTTSPRGEAFRSFQDYLLSLSKRGILLAVCSKNNHDVAIKVFNEHPEMVLKPEDIVSFRINWKPKSDNIIEIASELQLGLNSFVFVDDNIAEIEIVRQFVPEVAGIWLGDDPSTFTKKVQESRLFDAKTITSDDLARTRQYNTEKQRAELMSRAADMESYLASLEMVAKIQRFNEADVPRISQLINKSNQFNLTTIRRSESEVLDIMNDPRKAGVTVRLSDRFGDHGLIGILICEVENNVLSVDTWVMSCRVLKRQVEELMLNVVFEIASEKGATAVRGTFIPTEKNAMVKNHYLDLGFQPISITDARSTYEHQTSSYQVKKTNIMVD